MIKIENEVCPNSFQMKFIISGMRNPMNSWKKSDSVFGMNPGIPYYQNGMIIEYDEDGYASYIGDEDRDLMKRLFKAGTDHRKFMRMMTVYVDITAPLYWWKEFDTYKVGTVANSCSTMHKIAEKEFTLDDFSHEHLTIRQSVDILKETINALNVFRRVYLEGGALSLDHGNTAEPVVYPPKSKDIWWQMIQLLPSSYNQKRSVMLNYEILANMYKSRKNHKLDEWRDFCRWMEDLPFSYLITGEEN